MWRQTTCATNWTLPSQMLPDDVDNPIIFKFGTNDIPIIILSVTAEESTNALYKILDDKVSNPLARISGVGAVSISGTPAREIQVYCDPYKLEAYGVSIEGISAIIAQENRNTPGGSVDIGSNAYALRVQGEFTDAHQMDDLVIGHKNNKTIYLRDVARIEDSIEERAQETYNNGKKWRHDRYPKTIGSQLGEHSQEGSPEVAGNSKKPSFRCQVRGNHGYLH